MSRPIRYKSCVCCQTNIIRLKNKRQKYCKNCKIYIRDFINSRVDQRLRAIVVSYNNAYNRFKKVIEYNVEKLLDLKDVQ